jgi:hypothetical protein
VYNHDNESDIIPFKSFVAGVRAVLMCGDFLDTVESLFVALHTSASASPSTPASILNSATTPAAAKNQQSAPVKIEVGKLLDALSQKQNPVVAGAAENGAADFLASVEEQLKGESFTRAVYISFVEFCTCAVKALVSQKRW